MKSSLVASSAVLTPIAISVALAIKNSNVDENIITNTLITIAFFLLPYGIISISFLATLLNKRQALLCWVTFACEVALLTAYIISRGNPMASNLYILYLPVSVISAVAVRILIK